MNYPLISEYVEAIKAAEDNFEQLKHLRPVLDEDGEPIMTGGGFAEVFKMLDEETGKTYAVKCFLKEQEGRADAYRMIAEELEYVNSIFLTPIKYLDKELFVDTNQTDETEFPVLLMDWVDGVTLDKYIRENIYDEYALSLLAYQFSRLAMWLIPQSFAHGDLKPDNILVKDDGTLVLVDYDGMYVPAMKGQKARELGSPDFRHPSRTETDFDEHIDDFSLASILLSLKAIALQPERLDEYGASDRLLFSEKDYRYVSQCELLKALLPSDDSELNVLTSLFMIALEKKNLSNVSFRLFDLRRPKEPEYVNLSAEVTDEDLANAWTDEFGVKYSKDRKRLLKCYNPTTIKDYSIKPGTIVICDRAFIGCSILSEIHIPDSVISIGDWVFEDCSSLTQIHIPDFVTKIGEGAFSDCSSLAQIRIPDSVTSLGERAFARCSSLSQIHIPDSVTEIGDDTFLDCGSIAQIHIPYFVTKIGHQAFSGCSSLSLIPLPDFVTEIKSRAFAGCSSLSQIHIPNSVIEIGFQAFCGCRSIKSISVGKLNRHYDSRDNCNAIIKTESNKLIIGCTSTIIPNSVISIGYRAFCDCNSPSQIHIPDFVTNIEESAFAGCSSLSQIHIPDSVTSLGDGAFAGCSSLSQIHIPNSVTSIGGRAFLGCSSLSQIHIPDSVTEIEFEAFRDCSSLPQINIPNSVTKIGFGAFLGCSSLSQIHIPDSVTEIEYEAFRDCSSLPQIKIPSSVNYIGSHVFYNCDSLNYISIPRGSYEKYKDLLPEYQDLLHEETLSTEVTDEDLANAWTDEYGVKYSKDGEKILQCKRPIKKYSVKDGTIVICNETFRFSHLSEIHIPDSVKSIGERAFEGCFSLKEIHIPDSVKLIGEKAFSGCSFISEIHIPNSILHIGKGAFSSCRHIMSIRVDLKNKYYDSRNDCNAIINTKNNTLVAGCASTIIPKSVTRIGNLAFWGHSLSEIQIPNTVTHIGEEAFSNCSSLSEIHIPNSITYIGNMAFWHCRSLSDIYIPNSVTYIGEGAFSGCSNVKSIYVDLKNAHYDSRKNCNAIVNTKTNNLVSGCSSTVIPNTVTQIGGRAFIGCSSLSKIEIPNSVTDIGDYAFAHCCSLLTIHIPDSVTHIGVGAFGACNSLSQIMIPTGSRSKFEGMLPEHKDKLVEIGI